VKTSPQYYKVLLENDQVRVLEYRLKAGERGANAFAFGGRGMCTTTDFWTSDFCPPAFAQGYGLPG